MAIIDLDLPHVGQPQRPTPVDEHWLSLGLVYADLLHLPHDAVTGRVSTPTGTRPQSAPWGMSRGFGATLGVGTTDAVRTPLSTHSTKRTYIVRAQRNGAGGGGLGRIFDKRVSGAQSELLFWSGSGLNRFDYNRVWSGGAGSWYFPVGVGALGVSHVLAISYDSTLTSNVPRFFVDGNEVAASTNTFPTGAAVDNTDAYVVGNRQNDSARNWDGRLSDFYVFDSLLDPEEIRDLSEHIGALWSGPRIWVPVSAGGAPVLITATPGNAVAAGVQARINQARQVTGTAGNAVANGVTARVNQARTVVGTAGNATAAGITARVDQARRITGSAGNAVADGEAASIYLGRLITATPGSATADGVTATIFNGAVIQAAPGNAVAAGRPATILGDQIIVGNAGNATAAGASAQVGQNRRITGNTANATAEGLLASIYAGVTVQATPAVAVADGVDATLLQAITISATAGNAVAAGIQATLIITDASDDLYPLAGQSQDYPLMGLTQTYPLAGQTPS